jgi:protein involved in polysaccharide export with SLBB domain
MVSLPFISPVKASDLTERDLEGAISKAYEDAHFIKDARVSVTVAEARARTFSIQGNVGNPSEYQITRPDFRMLDALVVAKGPINPVGVQYAYVIRKLTPPASPMSTQPSNTQPEGASPPQDLLAPPSTGPSPQSRSNSSGAVNGTMLMDGAALSAAPARDVRTSSDSGSPVFQFDDIEPPSDVRIIRVPIDRLRQYGELKYNIVIRPGDMIIVPDPQQGVYYMGGHITRIGVYGLSGTKVTLKDAWISAGGADDFAIPGRTEIIRRIGADQEVFVRVDLGKIWCGEQPDIYLKPNDIVEVGTDFIAPFLAAGRNSFRFTYGFGFLYDRNFYNGPNGF